MLPRNRTEWAEHPQIILWNWCHLLCAPGPSLWRSNSLSISCSSILRVHRLRLSPQKSSPQFGVPATAVLMGLMAMHNLRLKQTWRVKDGGEPLPGAWSPHHIHHWAAGGPSRLCQLGCASRPIQPIGRPAYSALSQCWVSSPIPSFCWSRFTAKLGQLFLRNSQGLIVSAGEKICKAYPWDINTSWGSQPKQSKMIPFNHRIY